MYNLRFEHLRKAGRTRDSGKSWKWAKPWKSNSLRELEHRRQKQEVQAAWGEPGDQGLGTVTPSAAEAPGSHPAEAE